jgi:opacity protein-like surface antigen
MAGGSTRAPALTAAAPAAVTTIKLNGAFTGFLHLATAVAGRTARSDDDCRSGGEVMARLRILSVVATLAALATPVLGAEPLPPAPQLLDPAPAHEFASGWYLRGDLGYIVHSEPDWDSGYGVPRPAPLTDLKLQDTWSVGVGVGYRFHPWLRADLTADYRFGADVRDFSPISDFNQGFNIETGKLEVTTVLLNAYLDLGTWWGFTPYVGIGVGAAEKRVHEFGIERVCLSIRCGDPDPFAIFSLGPQGKLVYPDRTTVDLAWALMAGVAVDVSPGVTVDAGYRFLHLGEAASGIDGRGMGTKLEDIMAHEFRFGLRWELGTLGRAKQPPAYVVTPGGVF